MNVLLARYLDGDLTEEEAREFLEALETDSELAAELREHERLLSWTAELDAVSAPAGFTASVMERVRARPGRRPRHQRGPRWRGWTGGVAAAAALVLCFALGWQGARFTAATVAPDRSGAGVSTPRLGVLPAAWVAGQGESASLMAVRFVYAASANGPETVTVAGSFNGWDPTAIPMHREGDLWTAVVVLPRGNHEYMFVEDGSRWVLDPSAVMTRDDGFGGRNAVLDLST